MCSSDLSNHLAELDGICRVKDEGMTVDDGNFLSLWGRTDKGAEVFDNEWKWSHWVFISQLPREL